MINQRKKAGIRLDVRVPSRSNIPWRCCQHSARAPRRLASLQNRVFITKRHMVQMTWFAVLLAAAQAADELQVRVGHAFR